MIERPGEATFYFVGVSTSASLSMKLFPIWLKTLGLPPTAIRGVDIEVRGPREKYREVIRHIRENEQALGGIVTTHKIDIVEHAGDLFDSLDASARLFGEVSCISKRDGAVEGSAKDPISAGRALESFLPARYWVGHPEAQAFIIGAGGSGIVLSAYLMDTARKGNVPGKIVISNRSARGLENCRAVHARLEGTTQVEYARVGQGRSNDDILAGLPPGSLVVNASGMGKDLPGSPLADGTPFPLGGYAWDFNYRGSLEFLHQARSQQAERRLTVEDGTTYFVYGWAFVIAEVFHRRLGQKDLRALCNATYAYLGTPEAERPCG